MRNLRAHGGRARQRSALVRETLTGLARVRIVAHEKCGCAGLGVCPSCICVAVLAYARWAARRAARIQAPAEMSMAG